MKSATKNSLTLNQIIVEMITTENYDAPTWKGLNPNFDLRKNDDDEIFFSHRDWMDKAYCRARPPVCVCDASDPLLALAVQITKAHQNSIVSKADKAKFSMDNPWRYDREKLLWTPTPEIPWSFEVEKARNFESERLQAEHHPTLGWQRDWNDPVRYDHTTDEWYSDRVLDKCATWETFPVDGFHKRGPSCREDYSGMEPLIGRDARVVDDMLIFECAGTEIPHHDRVVSYLRVPLMKGSRSNRERIAAEIYKPIRYYNGPPCRPCMRKFGGKPPVRSKTLLKNHGCESCGINEAHLDYGMLPNDVQVANKNKRRWFYKTVERLGLTTFDGTQRRLKYKVRHVWPDKKTQHVWKDKKVTYRTKTEVRDGSVTFPKPEVKWDKEELQIIAARLEDHGLTSEGAGYGSVMGGQPSAKIVYVGSAGWEIDHLVHGTGKLADTGLGTYGTVIANDSEREAVKIDRAEVDAQESIDQDDWSEEGDLVEEPSEETPVAPDERDENTAKD